MDGQARERSIEWASGPLSELMSVLSAAALPARIQVFAPGAGGAPAGEVHLLAGGLNDALAGGQRGQEAVSALQRIAGARFVIDTRLPDPETGSLANPGPGEGNLAQRPLVEIMRYCEQYVLTCTLEVWRGEEEAHISYRRGELVGTVVGGSEAPERLPEVMAWKEGFFEIVLPMPVTPPVLAPSKRNTSSAAVVGDNAGAGPALPPSGERTRRQTDPFITLDAIKRNAPLRPTGALRPPGESTPKLPPGPPLPGLQGRLSATARTQPAAAAGPRPAPSRPASVRPLLAPPISRAAPSPAPAAAAATPARTAQAPVATRALPGISSARPQSTPAATAQATGTAPPQTAAASAPAARVVAPSPPAAAAGLPVERAPEPPQTAAAPAPAARVVAPSPPAAAAGLPVERAPEPPQTAAAPVPAARVVAPSPPAAAAGLPVERAPDKAPAAPAPVPAAAVATPVARDVRAATAASRAPIPSPAAKPSVAQIAAKPTSAPAPKPAAASSPQGSAGGPPPSSSPAALAAGAPAAPVQPARLPLAKPPSDQTVSAAAGQRVAARRRPVKQTESEAPDAIRGASTAAADVAPSAVSHISGEIKRPVTPARGTDERPYGVELAEDMQDPAAFVHTPPPAQPAILASLAQTTPTPISPAPQPKDQPHDEFAALASVPTGDLAVDIDQPRSRPGMRRAQRGPASWPLVIHVLIGVVLGAGIVVAYSAYYGLPLP